LQWVRLPVHGMRRQGTDRESKPDVADKAALDVMSFNIRVEHWLRPAARRRRRAETTAAIIRAAGADMVGLQEPRKPQLSDLARRLGGYAWTGAGRADGKDRGEFVPILYRTRRLELLDGGTFWLSATADVPGSRGWNALTRRIVTWARLRDRRTGTVLFHFNTHFAPVCVRAKRESARLVLRRVESLAGSAPALLTGDLNGTERSAQYRILTTGDLGDGPRPHLALDDARYLSRAGHEGPAGTWRGAGKPRRAAIRLDYVFVRARVRVLRHATLECDGPDVCPSDHLPVLARIVLPPKRRTRGRR
jgi:endonuclease/exonuclease/phosphatase family metal-dependent hydrolase